MFHRPCEQLSWVPVTKSLSSSKTTTIQTTCEYCNEVFDEVELTDHMKVNHKTEIRQQILENENSFCGTCIKNFRTPEDLQKHTLSYHLYSSEQAQRIEQEIFVCDHCTQIFFTKLSLQNHMLFSHMLNKAARNKRRIQCHFCKKNLLMRHYWAHIVRHGHFNFYLHCFKCSLKCPNQASLLKHVRSHPRHLYCNICQYPCERELEFIQHAQSHRKSISTPSKEKNIEKYYLSSNITNLWAMHKNIYYWGVWLPKNMHICVFCREICYSELDMRLHIQSHKPVDVKKLYVCDCGMEFTSKVLLRNHQILFKGKHAQDSSRTLNNEPYGHPAVFHTRVYICDCGVEFSSKIMLKQHKFQCHHTNDNVNKDIQI